MPTVADRAFDTYEGGLEYDRKETIERIQCLIYMKQSRTPIMQNMTMT